MLSLRKNLGFGSVFLMHFKGWGKREKQSYSVIKCFIHIPDKNLGHHSAYDVTAKWASKTTYIFLTSQWPHFMFWHVSL